MFNSCKCGCGLPVGKAGTYYNAAHKQAAYRARKRNSARALSRAVSAEISALMGDKKAHDVFEYLNRIPTAKYNHELDKALLVMITWFKSEIAKESSNVA